MDAKERMDRSSAIAKDVTKMMGDVQALFENATDPVFGSIVGEACRYLELAFMYVNKGVVLAENREAMEAARGNVEQAQQMIQFPGGKLEGVTDAS